MVIGDVKIWDVIVERPCVQSFAGALKAGGVLLFSAVQFGELLGAEFVRSRRRGNPGGSFGPGGGGAGISRRGVLMGGVGTGALLALPDLASGSRPARHSLSGPAAMRYAFVYGTPDGDPAPSASLVAAMCPASPLASRAGSRAVSRAVSPPTPVPLAVKLAAAPVSSADQATTALATVDTVHDGAKITLTLLDATSAAVARQGSVTVTGVPGDAHVLVTPVFAPGSPIVSVVMAITEPVGKRIVRKAHPHTGSLVTRLATIWRSHHALAYFDQRSGAMTGPFHLSGEPSLALSTAAANSSDLLLWTTREPQPGDPAEIRAQASMSRLSVFPLGSGKARLSAVAPAPWPGGEPVATLPTGDIARLVRGRHVQVCSARNAEVTEVEIPAFSQMRAKPSAVTMHARSDGTVFMTKPGAGVAVIADPADSFRTRTQIHFPVPASPLGAPWSKAVLSPAGETMYVLGSAGAGGLSAYQLSSGKLAASYSEGRHYYGLYQLPSGTLLAVQAQNPRLAFFNADLSPLGTADTNLHVSAIF